MQLVGVRPFQTAVDDAIYVQGMLNTVFYPHCDKLSFRLLQYNVPFFLRTLVMGFYPQGVLTKFWHHDQTTVTFCSFTTQNHHPSPLYFLENGHYIVKFLYFCICNVYTSPVSSSE